MVWAVGYLLVMNVQRRATAILGTHSSFGILLETSCDIVIWSLFAVAGWKTLVSAESGEPNTWSLRNQGVLISLVQ